MFQSARLKLTAWYLLIIMLVSIIFSLVIYTVINQEYMRIEHAQNFIRLQQDQLGRHVFLITPGDIDLRLSEARVRLRAVLILINLVILAGAGFAGYFLAGRTLRPIKQMVEEQNRFITDASHELRTPLTSLKSEIEVNLRDKSLKIEDAKKLLQSNLEEVNNLQYLSDNLIKLTQYQKIWGWLNFEEVNLKEIANAAQKKVANLAKRKNILIKNQIEDSIIINGDKQGLLEVFTIFLDNAIKYSPKETVVTLNSRKTAYSVEIEFKDQGIGIDEKDIPRLFDRFFRADKSRTKSEVGGYGLGLAIAKQIIEKHDGSVQVKSNIGKGTTFAVKLPIKHVHKII